MNDKFKIIIMIKKLISDYDMIIFNSKKELNVKDMILSEIYDILKTTYIANGIYDKDKKKKLQIDILARFKYLEYLTTKLNIPDKEVNTFLYKINMIEKYIQNWIKYTSK